MSYPISDSALAQHTAVLGKTGSGKTSTAKTIIEHVAPAARVCILDPIKSDWWGLTSSRDGKHAGMPFVILGGPRGHVPLHASSGKAIAEIVANGRLPLSILDMALFEPGGQSRFFIDFAETLLRKMRGVLYLVMEEAHLFAPKERANIGDENMAIHYAKMLATAGRSKGIRLVLVTQRTQSLHNALLGSCETMIAHRLTAPADQKPVLDWLKANVEKDVAANIAGSISSLPKGTAWVCSGEARIFSQIHFPPITTYDNTVTPTKDVGEIDVRTAAVDIEGLKTIIGDVVTEAAANDPKALKAEIAALKKQMVDAVKEKIGADPGAIERARADGYRCGFDAGCKAMFERCFGIVTAISDVVADARTQMDAAWSQVKPSQIEYTKSAPEAHRKSVTEPITQAARAVGTDGAEKVAGSIPAGRTNLKPAILKALDAIAWWRVIGFDPIDRSRACVLAGLSPRSSTFGVYLAELLRMGLIWGGDGKVGLTDAGKKCAKFPNKADLTNEHVHAKICSLLSGKEIEVFDAVYRRHPKEIARDDVARAVGLSPTASTCGVYLASVSATGAIESGSRGHVIAADWLFVQ